MEVKLDDVYVKFDDHKQEAYKLNFNVITYQKTYESNMSNTKIFKIDQEHHHTFVKWQFEEGAKPHIHLTRNVD